MGQRFTVLGNPQSKANSRMLINMGGTLRSIKSATARVYETDCVRQLVHQNRDREMIVTPVGVEITIWYKTRLSDLDPSIILDCMQKAGVYKNDRLVEEMHLYKKLDKDNPRSEIRVYEL